MLPHDVIRYPRMLYRGEGESCVVQSREDLLLKRVQGWRAVLLLGETPHDIGDELEPLSDPPTATDTPAPPQMPEAGEAPTRGRPKKIAE